MSEGLSPNSIVTARGFCPQCGGPVDMELGDSLLECGYCKTVLYLNPPGDSLVYTLSPIPSLVFDHDRIVYLPYWRLRGIYYRLLAEKGLQLSFIDSTVPALRGLQMLPSLGIAASLGSLSLYVGTQMKEDDFIEPEGAFTVANRRIETAIGGRSLASGVIGQERQIIRAPFEMLFQDDVLILKTLWSTNVKKVRFEAAGPETKLIVRYMARQRGEGAASNSSNTLDFIPLICPECGGDLPAISRAVCLFCPGCHRLWSLTSRGFLPAKARVIPVNGQRTKAVSPVFLPFWLIAAHMENFPLADRRSFLQRLLPYRHFPEEISKELPTFVIPAFRLGPNLFLRLARGLSLNLMDMSDMKDGYWRISRVHGIDLDLPSAMKALSLLMFCLFHNKKRLFESLRDAKIKISNVELMFLPFLEQGSYLSECQTGQSLAKAALSV